MFYHGSPVGGLNRLQPQVSFFSRDEKPCLFLSSDKAHATIYAAKSFLYPYGFNRKRGIVTYDEPYDGFLKETYSGKSGYVYEVENIESIQPQEKMLFSHITNECVEVAGVEFIEDVFLKLTEFESKDRIELIPYSQVPEKTLRFYHKWAAKNLAKDEFFNCTEEYPMYLKEKFPEAWKEACNSRETNETEGA